MAIIQDWKIRTTSAKCEDTGERFADGQEFYTCIFEDVPTDSFLRRDYAVESWKRISPTLAPPPFSFWKSTYKAPVAAADSKATADTSVEGMLRRFIDEDEPRTEQARYILALMLERKKVLVPTDSRETETRKLLFYEHAQTGDVFIVADPMLRLAEIEEVQREVSALLAAEEKRFAEHGSDSVGDVLDESGESKENSAEDEREESSGPKNESIAIADKQLADPVGSDPAVEPRK
jgi:hypothetical protein